jgi:prepilin signal peptidase PulO-like enzyme (type II secretory pathway)
VSTAAVGASIFLRATAVLGGVAAGAVAVWLARTVPSRMDRKPRVRSGWWWLSALLAGVAFGWFIGAAVEGPLLPAFLLFGGATLGLALIDLDHQLLPNRVLFPSLGIAIVLLSVGGLAAGEGAALIRAAAGGLTYFGVLLVVAVLAGEGFGMGDVKLALLLGLFLTYIGWGRLAVGFTVSVLLGGISAIALLLLTKRGRSAKFAYGPYLVVGSWIAIFWGQELIDWYLRTGN